MFRRQLLALLLAFGLFASACGGDDAGSDAADVDDGASSTTEAADADESDAVDDDDAGDEATTTEPVELTASWSGVTEDTIRLGFTTSDLEELKSLGLVDLDRGDPNLMLDTLIADVNARGGIHGRMLEAHLELVVPLDATQGDAACVRLTEDIGVFAVLAPFTGPNTDLNPCFNSRNSTIVVGGQPTPEQLEISNAPWISNTMFSDRRLAGVIQLMEDDGLLGDTVAVIVTGEEEPAARDIVIPALEDLGKNVVDVVFETNNGDILAGEAQFEVFGELFRTEGVDSVILVENTATFGATQLVRTGLDANFLVVDSAQLLGGIGALEGAVPEDLAGIIGSGLASEQEAWELEATQDCVRVFEEANPEITIKPTSELAPGESNWYENILIFCAPLRLFELAANAAGPELTHESFLAGAESLGDIDIPGQVFASMGPDKYGAADGLRLTVFDPTVGEKGGAVPYGPLEQIG
ncbi:MAG: ABC transporter substrate-binding protein [Acidimicrobiales bacterium]